MRHAVHAYRDPQDPEPVDGAQLICPAGESPAENRPGESLSTVKRGARGCCSTLPVHLAQSKDRGHAQQAAAFSDCRKMPIHPVRPYQGPHLP